MLTLARFQPKSKKIGNCKPVNTTLEIFTALASTFLMMMPIPSYLFLPENTISKFRPTISTPLSHTSTPGSINSTFAPDSTINFPVTVTTSLIICLPAAMVNLS